MWQTQTLRSIFSLEDSPSGDLLSIYTFNAVKNRWIRTPYQTSADSTAPSTIRVLTWNVDFMEPREKERLECILEHIQRVIFECTEEQAPEPCVMLLQEIEAEVIPVLLSNNWVRKHFTVTPISKWNRPGHAHYGNITLVARSVRVVSASSLTFANSHMSRNALMVDLQLGGNGGKAGKPIVRVANVHLESLPQGAKARPEQLSLVANALRAPGVSGGIVCGDMNAILESDRSTPKEVGLVDAYSDSDASDDADGHTWGYQPVCAFPPGRLDKILYTPGTDFAVGRPQRVGVGLRTAGGDWVSDHYALLASLSLQPK